MALLPSSRHGRSMPELPRHPIPFVMRRVADDDDELNTNPPTPCLGKRPQRPKPQGPGRPWGQKPLAYGRTVEGVKRTRFSVFDLGLLPPIPVFNWGGPYITRNPRRAGFQHASDLYTTHDPRPLC